MTKTILLLLIVFSVSLKLKANDDYKKKQTIIYGKIINYDPTIQKAKCYVNLVGAPRILLEDVINSSGNFSFQFDIYTPTDLWIEYKTNFLVLVHPGDSIYLEFDGNTNNRPELLNTINYSGNSIRSNKEAATFQRMYFSSDLYNNRKWKEDAIRNYEIEDYNLFLDTLQAKQNNILEKFISTYSPSTEAKVWASTFIQYDYINALSFYPIEHQFEDQSKPAHCIVPVSFYDPLLNFLPLNESMLISGYSLINYIDSYVNSYVITNILAKESHKQLGTEIGFISTDVSCDGITLVKGIEEFTPDSILRQLVFTYFFQKQLELSQIELFEESKSKIDSVLTLSYLREPLFDFYEKTRHRIDNPQIASDAILYNLDNSTANEIMNSILLNNRGKVIYIDCWADYCGPCRSEMPNSKRLMSKMKDKNIVFVFVCIDSNERKWKAILDEYQLGGQHFWLTKDQSMDWRNAFNITGVPYYIIIDANGAIVESGSHLRPDFAEVKMNELLNKK